MVKENIIIPKDNIAKTEEVREIKSEIPTYEKFMKSYENDGKVNYEDLSGGEIGEVRGYGPCSSCSGSNRNLTFKLKIMLENCVGGWRSKTVHNVDDARSEADKIVRETGHWEDEFLDCFSQENRRILFERINEEIRSHRVGVSIDETVSNHDWNDSIRRGSWRRRQEESKKVWDDMRKNPKLRF